MWAQLVKLKFAVKGRGNKQTLGWKVQKGPNRRITTDLSKHVVGDLFHFLADLQTVGHRRSCQSDTWHVQNEVEVPNELYRH